MHPRIRTIKPEFFQHEALYDAEQNSGLPLRVAFSGLWCVADREGRFEWRPRALKANILPFDDVDFDIVLTTLADAGFIIAYEVDGHKFAWIPSFRRHQRINLHERASALPSPKRGSACAGTSSHKNAHASTTMHRNAMLGKEGKGRERKGTGREGKGTEGNQKSKAGGSAENASPPPAPDNGAGDAPKPSRNGHPTWLTPYGQAWLSLYPDGEPPWGIMARWLRPLEKKHPPDVICTKMVAYFTTYGQYATWSKFAATLGDVKLAVDPKIAAEDAQIIAMVRDQQNRLIT